MRLLLGILVAFGCVALTATAGVSVLVGIAEQRHADRAYVVGFVPGAGCDDGHELYLRTRDGAVLDCVTAGLLGSRRVNLPGFTEEQEEQVEELVEDLGGDGLSVAEQAEVQGLVDRLVAQLPPEQRLYGEYEVWGSGRIWRGVRMALAGVIGLVVVFWLIARSGTRHG
ncbi:hypothetical protein ABT324_06820 [Saccharopolyspora sp. NPDC000359]|uniref:hypothetical protein n=1 Tax=Saccharopolyspora sp. NPDC000359 TaxID=3154251 RepID=UPI00332C2A37